MLGVTQARLDEARTLVEIAQTAISKIKVMNLEPPQRVDLREAARLLDGVLGKLPR